MKPFHVAETEIRQLQARYCDAVWRKDMASFADCFTEDCEWRIEGQVNKGRKACMEFMAAQFALTRCILITLRTPILEVGDGIASGRTYFTAQNALLDKPPITPIGMYYERFVDQGDRWRFTWRLFQSHYTGGPDMQGTFRDLPQYGAPPGMPPLDATR
jgi:hypothetical protein